MGLSYLILEIGSIPTISRNVAWRHKSPLDDTQVSLCPLWIAATLKAGTVSIRIDGTQLNAVFIFGGT